MAFGLPPDVPEEAQVHFHRGYEAQMNGRLDEAVEHYRRSIAVHATAEAHTFLGWAYSYAGRHEDAIAECKVAIAVDPDFGNPYNDIGAYLIEQGKWDESIQWFEKATRARRYEARSFPWFNMGRVHEQRRDWKRAKQCYREAFALNRNYKAAFAAMKRLEAMWN